MSRYSLIIVLLSHLCMAGAQGPMGSWTEHLPYRSLNFVSAGKEEVYGSTDFAITIFNKTYNEVKKLSKVNGLSDCGISTIEYSEDSEVLVIAYTTGNIDIYKDGAVTNIPDIMNTFISGDISINRLRTYGKYAYLTYNDGIIVIDIEKREIRDSWKPSADGVQNEVFDLNIFDDTVFAATGTGLFKAAADHQGLAYFGNWNIIPGTYGNKYNCLASTTGKLFINRQNTGIDYDSVFYYASGIINYLTGLSPAVNHSFESGQDWIIICSGSNISIIDSEGQTVKTIDEYGDQQIDARNAAISGNNIYIADRNLGLVRFVDENNFTSYIPEGPHTSDCYDLVASDGEIWVAGGNVDKNWNNTLTPYMFFNFTNRQWQSVMKHDVWDAMRVEPVRGEPGHIFVSTWGWGLYEYENNELINHWGENILGSTIPGEPYVRIYGLAMDNEKNLWITQSGIQNNIKVLMNNNNWITLPYNIDAPVIGDLIITESNQKWIILPGGNGLCVLDDNFTPGYFDDDRFKKLSVMDQSGQLLSNIFSIAEDLEGNIWIGTDQGPAVFYYPDKVFDEDIYASRIKVPRNDGTGLADYLLGTETVLSIATDGANRKWLGTSSSGAFMISEEGNELVRNYNTSNSPLLSDRVISIATDGLTGEVWLGTGKGLVTVRETGTAGSEDMNDVYAYPNPVREDFTGDITITGLARNSNVKITDISGNLVFETTSTGGDAIWDMKTHNGKNVSTGVYLVFCNNEDGTVSTVTKILIIR
ncbi:MAG: T9SS type A sorting domain-containing protein [Bacteroidales bacterium]|nr:T9SS type A sorting domain-containing protein [Bacteroidales bacterium]